jgi:hypothetical protein
MRFPEPKSGLPREATDGLYNLEFLPESLSLNDFIQDADQERKEVQDSLREKILAPTLPGGSVGKNGVPKPLTAKEAEEVDRVIETQRADIARTRQRIAETRSFIDNVAAPKGGPELSFKLDISRKPTLRRAVKKVFGRKTDEITYSMYKFALEEKRRIERQEAKDYVSGDDE